MGKDSKIDWCHHSFNPWWGCAKVSPGCANCYAETFAKRTGHDVWGNDKPRRMLSGGYWMAPYKWDRMAAAAGTRHRVFCGSMCDWAEARLELLAIRARLFDLIESTPNLLWLLLTKRPENIGMVTPPRWRDGWPSNTVAMTSVENQEQAEIRVPLILQAPAPLHGLSMEPLLGPVDLTKLKSDELGADWNGIDGIDWVIVGGESGGKARAMHPEWVRKIRDDCLEYNVTFNFKQWGEWATKAAFGDVNPAPNGVRIKPMWMRDDGEVSEQPLSITLGDEPPEGEESEHNWIPCARIGKKVAGRHLDGVVYNGVLT